MHSQHTVDNSIHWNANPLHMNGHSFENNCNICIYGPYVVVVFSVGIACPSAGESVHQSLWLTSPDFTLSFVVVAFSAALLYWIHQAYRWLLHRIDASAVVGILVLDLSNFHLQTSIYTSRICSYSVVIDSLRV